MNVIHIFGASGSGTSTLGRYICENTVNSGQSGYYFMDTDDYFWMPTDPPYTVKRDKEERLRLMRADIAAHENVVISGSLCDWGDSLIPSITLAVRLVTDTEVRLERLKRRESKHFGSRIEKGGDMYEAHKEFLDWAAEYDTGGADMRSKLCHDIWQKLLRCELLTLDGNQPLCDSFETVMSHTNN